jgi:hypothetical protein
MAKEIAMGHRGASKLLAVALFAGAASAHAGPAQQTATTSEPIVERVEKEGFVDLRIKRSSAPEVVIKPRVLPNYRPACGNTGGKSPRATNCTAAEIRTARDQARIDVKEASRRGNRMAAERMALMATAEAVIRAQPSLKARVLINGRPACGNTMSKASPPAFCEIEPRR